MRVYYQSLFGLFECFGARESKRQVYQVAAPSKGPWLDLQPHEKKRAITYVAKNGIGRKSIRISNKGIRTLSPLKAANPLQNYNFVSELGAGEFGVVNLYKHFADNRLYAIKACHINTWRARRASFNEVLVSLAVTGLKGFVRIKKVLVDGGRRKLYVIMEPLKEPTILESRAVWEAEGNRVKNGEAVRGKLAIPEFGITLWDRSLKSFMIREELNLRRVVQIDYGLSKIKLAKVYAGLKKLSTECL